MKPRPILAILLLIVVPPLVGALIAPMVNAHLITALHRMWPGFEPFNAPEFRRVMDRCVLAVSFVLLFPALRLSGLLPRIRGALKISGDRVRVLAVAAMVGLLSMSCGYLLGWLMGGYRLNSGISAAQILGRAAMFLAGSIFIGLFEETFFRGFFFGALRPRLNFWLAAIIASLFFASVHFLHPNLPANFDASRWSSGFAVMPLMIQGFDPARDGAFAITLFLMGLTLCRLYETDGHLWRAIGLHGGWVWAMQLSAFVFNHNWAIMRGLLGPGDYVSQGALAIVIVAVFFVWAILRGHNSKVQSSGQENR